MAVYRMTQMALTLASADAAVRRVRIEVRLDPAHRLLHWAVEDDGRGGLEAAPGDPMADATLADLDEQAWAWGGELDRHSGAHGQGRRLAARLRLDAAGAPPAVGR
jgi:signal transduction histidine kinase